MYNRISLCIGLLLSITAATVATAQYEIPWHTVDGGGATFSTGGTYSLGGTIGQPDASSFAAPMVGGTYELVGGFWAPSASTCPCLGDMNADGERDGLDVQSFVECITIGGTCACADVDGGQGLGMSDVSVFVAQLLSGAACP